MGGEKIVGGDSEGGYTRAHIKENKKQKGKGSKSTNAEVNPEVHPEVHAYSRFR